MLQQSGLKLNNIQQAVQVACMRTNTHGHASCTAWHAYILLRLIALNVLEVAACWLGRTCMHHRTAERDLGTIEVSTSQGRSGSHVQNVQRGR